MPFVHLHVHSQYSILDGLSSMKGLFSRAKELQMPAIALTDHGNMFGVKEFLKEAYGKGMTDADGNPLVKPIIGCEVYVTRHFDHTLKDNEHKSYYHLILLAKNYEGYRNLMKIVSAGHIEGMYYRPRVSHEVIEKYHENIICSSACIAGEVAHNLDIGDKEAARKAIEWYKKVFGDDFYLEVMLHKTEVPGLSLEIYERQKAVNEGIFELAEQTHTKVIATNDAHFVRKEDGPVHDRLICLTTNAMVNDTDRLHYTQQEYIKSEDEMRELFPDHPEVIDNTLEVADKVENYSIDRDPILPKFDLDPSFLEHADQYLEKYKAVIDEGRCDKKGNYRGDEFCLSVAYLCELTYKGAHRVYGENLTEEQQERIDFELKTICRMGFPDYFLIVQDYIAAARKEGWLVGPGRGSAAGSVVAYCLKITNLDPIKYQLLFERFLNPDRISMPDIDVDFENLEAAHRYVEQKYGSDHVSRVITFGTMAAKGAIKDVARISEMSFDDSNNLTKMVPDHIKVKKEKTYPFDPELDEVKPGFTTFEKEEEAPDGTKVIKHFQKGLEEVDEKITLVNCFASVPEFKDVLTNGSDLSKEVLDYAQKLEGCIRQVGQHACATIIGRGDLTEYIPICLSRDKETNKDVWTSQYDGHYIEQVGLLKMDFLGLNTLSIIHETLNSIKKRKGIDIDIDTIPLDDMPTYELYGRGNTTAVFQFESPGMREWLQKLHPSRFEDLIAMNALYRPGPMDYIPDFVDRKHGVKAIEYDLPDMARYLEDTYGITVYQEQVMLLSRELAGFTRGESDKLRKAMGKKQIDVLNSLKDKFLAGGQAKGHPKKVLDKIWKDWEKFAAYAFNKSHATCYAFVSYQTAWLKCHYTADFLAANMSCNLNNMEELQKIMTDCKMHGIKVLCPDINESHNHFSAVSDDVIRFGLGGLKGFGSNIVDYVIQERETGGQFADIYDFAERTTGKVNHKAFETLVNAGAFDSFGLGRAQLLCVGKSGETFIDDLIKYADVLKKDKEDNSASLFGDAEEFAIPRPEIPQLSVEEDLMTKLQKEKEVVGMYLSSHPLEPYLTVIENFTNCCLGKLKDAVLSADKAMDVRFAGMVSSVEKMTSKNGNQGVKVVMEDYTGAYDFVLFGKEYENFISYMQLHQLVYVEGEIAERFKLRPEEIAQGKKPFYVLRFKKMCLLCNAAENLVKSVDIMINASQIDAQLRKGLASVLKSCKGKTPVNVLIQDDKTGYKVELVSRKFFVYPNSDLIAGLEKLNVAVKLRGK